MPKTSWKYTKTAPDKGSSNMLRRSNASSKLGRTAPHAGCRDAGTIKRLKMYTNGKPIRNKEGTVVGGQFMMKDRAGDREITAATGRIAPDRRWFGNTRVVTSGELEDFREKMNEAASDPYSIVLKRRKLPMGLLQDNDGGTVNHKDKNKGLLANESFASTFGTKSQRKRVKVEQMFTDRKTLLEQHEQGKRQRRGDNKNSSTIHNNRATPVTDTGDANGYAALLRAATDSSQSYRDANTAAGIVPWGRDQQVAREKDWRRAKKDDLFLKGQSRRIWAEFYKVLDCSDVILHVIDARDVPGTRCAVLERHVQTQAKHKQLVFVLNKVDLVPNWVAKRWLGLLARDYPTVAFHASLTHAFGKGALLNLLRQFGRLHDDKKTIGVGVVGYPNVGKSSVINTLLSKKSCKVAPVPGETKIWQYLSLFRNISLIDCPGVVVNTYGDGTEDEEERDAVLKGVVRAERLENPEDYVPYILLKVKKEHIVAQYGSNKNKLATTPPPLTWETHIELLEKLALRSGRLLKGGEPCLRSVAITIINDFQRGKLPHYVAPPELKQGEEVTPNSNQINNMGGIQIKKQNLDHIIVEDTVMANDIEDMSTPNDQNKNKEDEEEKSETEAMEEDTDPKEQTSVSANPSIVIGSGDWDDDN